MATLNGRVALVTGAARGIGRAIALELACRGAAIAVNYRTSRAAAEELLDRIGSMGVPGMLVPGDVAAPAGARAVVAGVLDAWRRLDILVNNAGVTRDKSMRRTPDDEWSDVIHVNLNGTLHCTNAAVPVMIGQKFGRVVNITPYVGNGGAGNGGVFAFTRKGVLVFGDILSFRGILVNQRVCPRTF
jgi:acetoacetyl-CoA reductase/3-oxoacyl-[acyl-carrier protein] reductase